MSASPETPLRSERRARRSAALILLCLLAFVGLEAAAMALYPGGNWLERGAVGHRFFANFFCDLTQPVSLSGVSNPFGSRLAQLGMLCFAVALAVLFWLVPRHFPQHSRAERWARGLGECAVLSFVAVPLTPSERFGSVHAALALVAGVLGIAAASWTVAALWLSKRRVLAVLGALSIAVGAFDAALFAYHLGDAAPPPLIVPATQKVAALLVLVWIASVAWSVLLGHDGERMKVLP